MLLNDSCITVGSSWNRQTFAVIFVIECILSCIHLFYNMSKPLCGLELKCSQFNISTFIAKSVWIWACLHFSYFTITTKCWKSKHISSFYKMFVFIYIILCVICPRWRKEFTRNGSVKKTQNHSVPRVIMTTEVTFSEAKANFCITEISYLYDPDDVAKQKLKVLEPVIYRQHGRF